MPSGAVFLSYASQDAEPARRIADALKAQGVEVWFDQSELRGGDAWDAKIRRQIKECALFVPIISANTNARPEGYFRLEWKLAVDRSHLVAHDHPFLFPVVVDDSPNETARVPDKFYDVQWTRLELRETAEALAKRVAGLLAGGLAEVPTSARARDRRRHPVALIVGIVVVAAVAIAGSIIWSQRIAEQELARMNKLLEESRAAQAAQAARGGRGGPATDAARRGGTGGRGSTQQEEFRRGSPPGGRSQGARGTSESRQLVAQARSLYEPWEGASRENFDLAEKLLSQVTENDPADAEAWAALGILNWGYVSLNRESQPAARRDQSRVATENAMKLAPTSFQSRLAQATLHRLQGNSEEAEKLLRQLMVEAPNDRFVLRTLAAVLRSRREWDEALAIVDKSIALPGVDPAAYYNKYLILRAAKRYAEAEAALDRGLELQPELYLYRAKIALLTAERGDLDAAAALLAKVPASFQLDDGGAFLASRIWMWRRENARALSVLRAFPRDKFESPEFTGPKSVLVGEAHRIAGSNDAAQAEWRAGLAIADRELELQPNSHVWMFWRARLLASLGRGPEADVALRTALQLAGAAGQEIDSVSVHVSLGRNAEAVQEILRRHAALLATGDPVPLAVLENQIRFDPQWDRIRNDPEIQRLLAVRR